MDIKVKKSSHRHPVAYRGRTTGNLYLKAKDGKVISIGTDGRHEKQAGDFASLANLLDQHEALYEGDVVEITL